MIRGISDRTTFGAIRRSGIQVRSRDLLVRHLPSPDDAVPRVAFTIPRRVGTAVVRNRIRRRMRAILAERERSGGRIPAGAMVFIIHPGCATMTYPQLRDQVTELLDELVRRADGSGERIG